MNLIFFLLHIQTFQFDFISFAAHQTFRFIFSILRIQTLFTFRFIFSFLRIQTLFMSLFLTHQDLSRVNF
jgi:hypothetical protein